MATYYWVGGNGTWNGANTANWSASSGGAGGSGPPNSTDTVIFDSASGTGTCTTATGSACATATLNSATLTLTLGANHTMSGTFTLTQGALAFGSNTLTCNIFSSSNTNTRSIAFGTGSLTITGSNTTVFVNGTTTGFTYTGIPNVNLTYSGSVGTRTMSANITGIDETKALNFNVSAGTDIFIVNSNSGVKNLNFTGFSGTLSNFPRTIYGNFIASSGMTVSAGTSATTFAATSGIQQIITNGKTLDHPITQNNPGATLQLQDNLTIGSTRTFTLTAGALDLTGNSGNWTLTTGIFNSSNSNTRSIAFGTGNITVTGSAATVMTLDNGTNFSYTGTPNFYFNYSGSTGTRSILGSQPTTGGTENNAVNVYVTAGSDTLSIGGGNRVYKTIDLTGFSGTLSALSRTLYGNFVVSATCTVASGTGFIFSATSGIQSVTLNGKTLDMNLSVNTPNATVKFLDALTQGSTRTFTITNGTVQLKNGVTSTVGAFATSGTDQKFLQSTLAGSQATLSEASGTVDVSYLTIRDINATGGAIWNAFVDQFNIDAGNNDGWDFGISPVVGGNEYTYQLRSFTQPRRF